VADVTAGEDKTGAWGCDLLFHTGSSQPWRFYGITVEDGAVIGDWVSALGYSWGADSPDGPIQATVEVLPNGRLEGCSHSPEPRTPRGP
jgi:hypothetical protein